MTELRAGLPQDMTTLGHTGIDDLELRGIHFAQMEDPDVLTDRAHENH
ncbi:hypothetical protein GCM10011374_25750 [Kocuria dechangensis]|uniref:Uncharacterized protein n=1 Tax=Kocuria dechangensis TaxID=1176249 RepID=A0A917LWI5_9MICC|nr:hypothetical protein [Kocuria dechangensis]GGG61540.1 hypothetical protein GCM10011374_25750 [Kocuria dechangensis]